MKLKYKILMQLLIVTIIPITVTAIAIYYYTATNMVKNTFDNLNYISNFQQKRIGELIIDNQEKMDTVTTLFADYVASHPSFVFNTNAIDPELEFLKQIPLKPNQYECLAFLDLDGTVISSTNKNAVGKIFSNHEVFTKGKNSKYFGLDLNQEGKSVLFLTTPIMQNKTIVGKLVAQVKSDELFSILADYTGLGKTGETLLGKRTSDGNLLVISPSRYDPDSAFKEVIPSTNIANPLVRASYGEQSFLENAVDHRGNTVMAVTSYFPLTQWAMVVKINSNEALSGIENVRNVIWISAGTMVLSSILVSLFISRTISAPIDKLRLSCRRITTGYVNDAKLEIVASEPEYKDLTSDINYMVNEFNKAVRDRINFISMVSHELKTPLAPIMGYCEMLSDPNMLGGLKPSQSHAIAIIYDNIIRLRKLINDLLTAQSLELNNMKFNQSQIHVKKFMNDILSSNMMLMKKKNLEFVNTTKNDIIITSDNDRLSQIFINLIQNAVDFVQQNGKIEIGASHENNNVIFYVKDNGIGIPKNKQQDLFKKFYQVDTSLKRTHGGTGLGLSICKGLVERLGGKIWFESDEGKGTEFYFSVPINIENKDGYLHQIT